MEFEDVVCLDWCLKRMRVEMHKHVPDVTLVRILSTSALFLFRSTALAKEANSQVSAMSPEEIFRTASATAHKVKFLYDACTEEEKEHQDGN